jgi:hypothetical protein
MTRKAFVKQADMKRMASIVKEYGICVEVEADGVLVRFAPDNGQRQPEEFETFSEWQEWRDRQPDRLLTTAKKPLIIL